MRVKTFEAATMQEALDTIKRELGDEAFILSSKTRRRVNAQGREETIIEVTAAVDAAAPPVALPATGTYGLRPSLPAQPKAEPGPSP